jgi:hypothetical protein
MKKLRAQEPGNRRPAGAMMEAKKPMMNEPVALAADDTLSEVRIAK